MPGEASARRARVDDHGGRCWAIAAAGGKLDARPLASSERCAKATLACTEDDGTQRAACFTKARATCAKVTRGCRPSPARPIPPWHRRSQRRAKIGIADLRSSVGLGFTADDARCGTLGVSRMVSVDGVATCVSRNALDLASFRDQTPACSAGSALCTNGVMRSIWEDASVELRSRPFSTTAV
jgi:hypothetical protein